METCYDYLRTYAPELGSRIVEMYPPLQGPKDPHAPELKTLLRKPLPVQGMTITGCVKYLQTAKAVTIVGECGTGKTLMAAGIAHAHAEGKPYSSLVMCPPHLVLKWAREIFITIPNARVFVIYDFRNGGDPKKPHGVTEMRMRNGHAVSKGEHTTLAELRGMGRRAWRSKWKTPTFFVVSKETGKLSYYWKHAYSVRSTRLERRLVTNPDTGLPIPKLEGGYLREPDFADSKFSEQLQRASKGTLGHSPLWQADRSKTQRMAPLEFIGRYMRNFWDYAIADEFHQLANDTAQGNNLDVLRRCANKLIGATGTLMGGYASDLFRLLFRMNPRKMVAEGFDYSSSGEGEFQALYGVLESIERIRHSDIGEDPLPSCSAIEALERQEPFINQVLATSALAMLSRLLRYGTISHYGAFFNAVTGRMSILPIDRDLWRKTQRRSLRLLDRALASQQKAASPQAA